MVTQIPVVVILGHLKGSEGVCARGRPAGLSGDVLEPKRIRTCTLKPALKLWGACGGRCSHGQPFWPSFSECPGNEALTFGDFLGAVIGVCIYSAPFCAAV